MKILKWVLIGLGIIIVLFVAILAYHGMFSKLEISAKQMGPYTFVYERFVGPYQETGKVFYRVHNALEEKGIKATRGIGIYYDDPAKTSSDKLRSDCGSIVEAKDKVKLAGLKKFKIKILRRQHYVVTEMAVKSPINYMIGPMKCYPALVKYMQENKLKWSKDAMPMELYDVPAKKIYYMIGIVK